MSLCPTLSLSINTVSVTFFGVKFLEDENDIDLFIPLHA